MSPLWLSSRGCHFISGIYGFGGNYKLRNKWVKHSRAHIHLCNGRNHDAERGQLAMRIHHSLCKDGSFVASERIACHMALAVSYCNYLFNWLMALLMFGIFPTRTAMFAFRVIIRATKGRVSHSEAEACREPIPTSPTGRNLSSYPTNYSCPIQSLVEGHFLIYELILSLLLHWDCHELSCDFIIHCCLRKLVVHTIVVGSKLYAGSVTLTHSLSSLQILLGSNQKISSLVTLTTGSPLSMDLCKH